MPTKKNPDMTTGAKLLKLFRRLLLDGKKHYLQELAQWLDCSPQTVIRLIGEIENEIGTNLEIGQENRKRWYRISPSSQGFALDTAELRYLTLCKELASPYLPEQVRERIEQSIASFSHVLLESSLTAKDDVASQYTFFSKGRIDYTPHFEHLKQLENAIEDKRICLITYRAAGKARARELPFAPSRIIGMNNAFYVIGAKLSDDLSEFRHFINLCGA